MRDKIGLLNPKISGQLLIFHFFLGASVLLSNLLVILWVIFILLYFTNILFKAGKHEIWKLVFILSYVCGIEILPRIANTSPFLPYEFGKYAFVFFLSIGMLKFKAKNRSVGFWIILLSLPGLLFIPTYAYRDFLINSFLGIFLLGWAAHSLNEKSINPSQLQLIFLGFLYGIIAITGSVIIRSPSLSEISFELGANFETAGGFGSNQVSTVLGAGFMITALSFLFNIKLFPLRNSNLILSLVFIFRSLLTFSRGGVLGGVLGLLLSYIIPGSSSGIKIIKSQYLILIGFSLIGVFYFVNELTGNAILDRYKGETYATKLGVRDVDSETLTSGRTGLMKIELETFIENPFFGVGPGGGYAYRERVSEFAKASHTEATRLLAEHGIPGFFMALIFLFFPVVRLMRLKYKRERTFVTAFFILAIFSSFHASMRTTITPFFWALGCMRFPETTNSAHKKS